jgi:hypothetical protein
MAEGAGMTEQDDAEPLGVADLNIAEQFVLWALRTRLGGTAKREHLEHGFRLAHDAAIGGAALAAFESWFDVLSRNSWRDLYLHYPPCPCLSDDERGMLDLVASGQAGDEPRLYRVAAGLVHARAIALLQQSSRSFAVALRRLNLRLPGRPMRPWRGPRPHSTSQVVELQRKIPDARGLRRCAPEFALSLKQNDRPHPPAERDLSPGRYRCWRARWPFTAAAEYGDQATTRRAAAKNSSSVGNFSRPARPSVAPSILTQRTMPSRSTRN